MMPLRTITLLCRLVVQEVLVPPTVTFPPMANGARVFRKVKSVVWMGALPRRRQHVLAAGVGGPPERPDQPAGREDRTR